MVRFGVLLGTFLLAAHTAATNRHALFRPSHDLEHHLLRDADMLATLTRRQDSNPVDTAPQVSTTPASGDASRVDLEKWEADTRAACDTAIIGLNGLASNPSGLAVCYNLPFLDNSTGVFLAELRMYNVSAPIDPWVGVSAADLNMTLSYLGATVQLVDGPLNRRDVRRSFSEEGALLVERQVPGAPPMVKVLMYVGQINDNLMGTAMTRATLQPLLIPQIELFATTPGGQEITATVSSQNASFVNGVFAGQGQSITNPTAAAASATAQAAQATPFVLPGTSLAFFPVGLVITCAWTGILFLAVGLGTVNRIQYREQYRRRMKRDLAAGVRTI